MAQAVAAMQQRNDILWAEPNYLIPLDATPNNAQYSSQYALTLTQTDLAWELWNPSAQRIIAIIDTGCQTDHPALANKIVSGQNFSGVSSATDVTDNNGHGTHCAGIAAGQINGGGAIAGVAGWNGLSGSSDTSYIKIMPVKVFDGASGTTSAVVSGIDWAVANGAHILSLSLGGSTYSDALATAVQKAWQSGCLVVAAAGNNGHIDNAPNYPANLPNVLSVANSDSTDTLNFSSVYGSYVKTAAPGTAILSAVPGSAYGNKTGTSMACPFVAGEAALIWSHAPKLSNANVMSLIVKNVDAYTPYYSSGYIAPGAGRVNVLRALASISPKLLTVNCNPRGVRRGNSVTGSVTLDAAAPPFGAVVSLSSGNAGVTVPSTVTVSAGQTSATFTVTTSGAMTPALVRITASYAGRTFYVGLRVLP